MTEFIATLGNMIKEIDKIILDTPPYLRDNYANLFSETAIQGLLFDAKDFEEEACEYCRKLGWREPR